MQQDITKIDNTVFKVVSYSSASNKSKGTIILFHSNLGINSVRKGSDQEGRIAYVKTIIEGTKIAFLSVYAPNMYDNSFYSSLYQILHKLN